MRKASLSGTFAELKTVPPDSRTYQDTGLTPNTRYYYQVMAYNGVWKLSADRWGERHDIGCAECTHQPGGDGGILNPDRSKLDRQLNQRGPGSEFNAAAEPFKPG
jgi:hypothetical protein